MYPNSFAVFLLLSWFMFSFLFWRVLRNTGAEEDKIFDLTFYATVIALIVARGAFVATHWELFADTWLKILALWVTPGLSWYGALFGGVATLVSMSRGIKVRLGLVLDALAIALPPALIVGFVGAFLGGTVSGKVALYEILGLFGIMLAVGVIGRKATRDKRPYGFVGVWFFIVYSFVMFFLELTVEARVYWLSLNLNQWVLVAMFAESLGALYVRGGGREAVRPLLYKLYAKFSKRRSE